MDTRKNRGKGKEIHAALLSRISRGKYAKGSLLPSERTLAEEFGVTRLTLRKVLQRLDHAGLLVCKAGIGYEIVSSQARNRKTKERNVIGVILGYQYGDFSEYRMVTSINTALSSAGYSMLLGFSEGHVGQENNEIERFLELGMSGLILIPATKGSNLSRLESLVEQGFPIVALGEPRSWCISRQACKKINIVAGDNSVAVRMLMDHLCEQKHTRFAFIGNTGLSSGTHIREKAFVEYVRKAGIPDGNRHIDHVNPFDRSSWDSFAQRQKPLFKARSRPTAVFCMTARIAAGVLAFLSSEKIAVPGDVCVVAPGIDGDFSGLLNPSITSAEISQEEMTTEILSAIQAQMTDPGVSRVVRIQPQLVVRQSTGPAIG